MNTESVKMAIDGNEEILFNLISEIKDKLYRIAYSYLKNEEDALEAIQETSYRALLNIKKLKKAEFFRTWITRILINYCCTELKRKKRLCNNIDYIESKGHLTDNTTLITLRQSIECMDEKYRDIIMLKYFEDFTTKEIAYIKKIPEGTVKTRLRRGLNFLQSRLDGGDFFE